MGVMYIDRDLNDEGNQSFYPSDIVVTTSGLLVVPDCGKHYIQVLDKGGQLVVRDSGINLGIEFPFTVLVESEETIWVACDSKFIHAVEMKY